MDLTKNMDEKLNNNNLRKSEKRKLEAIKYYLEGMKPIEIEEKLGCYTANYSIH